MYLKFYTYGVTHGCCNYITHSKQAVITLIPVKKNIQMILMEATLINKSIKKESITFPH